MKILHGPVRFLLLAVLSLFVLSACSVLPIQQHTDNSSSPAAAGPSFAEEEALIIALLLVAAVVSLGTQRYRIPYTVGLVLVGFALSFLGKPSEIKVIPEIILLLLVPPLVYEAAFHLSVSDLRHDWLVILVLAVPGVILTTFLVGGLVSFAAGISLTTALIFGALISATDPVSVVSLFRSLGVPKRLQILLEGESLLNDGTAIVLFNLIMVVFLTGQFNLATGVLQFFIVSGGGILVGSITGLLISQLIGRIDNYLVETTLTTVLAYGSYLIAENVFHVSGVLAVVAAGIVSGQIGPKGMSPTTRIVVFNFWEYAAFLANSFIFLIIGLQMDWNLLISNAAAIGWAILAVLVARAVTVYGLSWLGKNIPRSWKNVLFWGGLRGAISLALAMSLSTDIPNRAQLQAMAFGVVLFTLVVEGLTMEPLVRRMGLIQINLARENYEKHHARALAQRSATAHLHLMNRRGLISDYTWDIIKPILDLRSAKFSQAVQTAIEAEPSLHREELSTAYREALRSQRSTIIALYHDHILSDESYEELAAEIDFLLTEPDGTWSELTVETDPPTSPPDDDPAQP